MVPKEDLILEFESKINDSLNEKNETKTKVSFHLPQNELNKKSKKDSFNENSMNKFVKLILR